MSNGTISFPYFKAISQSVQETSFKQKNTKQLDGIPEQV